MLTLEKTLLWVIRSGLLLLLFMPLIVTRHLFFPYISGKNFFFRVIVEIIFGVWVALALLSTRYRPKQSPLLWALAAFLLALTISTIFGANPYHSFWSNFERMEGLVTHIHIFALFLVAAHTLRGLREWGYFFAVSLGVSAIAGVYGILQGVGAVSVYGGGRPAATFGNSIYLATFLMFHLYILSLFFHNLKNILIRAPLLAVFILELVAFFFASSRGGFVGFLAGIFLIAISLLIVKVGKIYRFISIFLLCAVIGVFVLIYIFPHSPLVKNYDLLTRLSNVSLEKLSQEPRLMIWGVAWQGFKARPVFGWGPENFIIVYGKFYNPNLYGNEPWFDRAHNMLLEWLVASGLVGFIIYLSIFVSAAYVIRVLMKQKTLDNVGGVLLFGFLVAYIIQNAFVFDNVVTYTILTLLFAFLHALYSKDDNPETTQKSITPLKLTVAACALIMPIIFIYTLNIKEIMAASRIVNMLQAFSAKGATVDLIIEKLDRTIALNTFGTTESRERFADTIVQSAMQISSTTNMPPQVITIIDRAISELKKETMEQPQVAKYPIFLGKLYTVRQSWTGEKGDEALKAYNHALEIAPNYVQTYLGIAELQLIMGQKKKAAEAVEKAFELPSGLNTKAALFFPVLSVKVLAGEFQDAIRFLDDYYKQYGTWPLITNYSDDTNIKLLIDRAITARKDPEGRLSFFKLLETRIDHPMLYFGLADSYAALGKIPEARQYVLKAIALDPSLKGQLAPEFLKLIEPLP